jgi:hypothetical protein
LAELNAKIGMLSSKNKLPKIFFIIVIVFIVLLIVDGVKQTTKPIKITYKKPTKTKAGDDYILEAKVDKTTYFCPIKCTKFLCC